MRRPWQKFQQTSSFSKAATAAFSSWQSSLVGNLGLLGLLAFMMGCGGPRSTDPNTAYHLANCKPIESVKTFNETPYVGSDEVIHNFQNIRASINSACATCHQSPAKSGGFTYVDSYLGKEISIDGKVAFVNGFFENAQALRDSIFHNDPKKQMPPAERRAKNPESFLKIGRELDLWIQAGKPEGNFVEGKGPDIQIGKKRPPRPHGTSELGECVPVASVVGFDFEKDRYFSQISNLPEHLSDTDMVSLDPLTLAERGTLAYNVEYPLWADNADKGRWVHVPWILKDGQLQKQSIEYDAKTQTFKIPDNTRFYKTFYKAVTLPNKQIRMRRMETRIIVARTPWKNSLFGSYQWDETEQVATLVTAPYRDGTAWKDVSFNMIIDEGSGKTRMYAIPGRQRCIDCHSGSSGNNFVLGFTPLQINKRRQFEAGRLEPSFDHDLSQVQRFIDYGLVANLKSADELPKLETSGRLPPRNDYDLRANAYFVGNCFHCHNTRGMAFTPENGVQLALGPGDTFSFNTQQKSVQIISRRLVHQRGELDSSHLWRKVADSSAQLGLFSQMPMHTPGAPDCQALTVVGKWIRSFESDQAAEEWKPECKASNEVNWIDMDLTWPSGDIYTPRRGDWADTKEGMPLRYSSLEFTPALQNAVQSDFPVGYWLKKPACKFPTVDIPKDQRLPWMMKGDKPKRPFGEIYYSTPGAYFYKNTCAKCHGPKADGDASLAKAILNWSGGNVRVANFMEGMYGKKNENLKIFDRDGKNYSGQYLIWMAMEGTRVKFPSEVASVMGKHGGQMLNGIRDKCLAQISLDKASSPQFMDHEIFRRVCFMDNLYPGHPDLAFDPNTAKPLHADKVDEWLDRAAFNAGWAIHNFLKEMSDGKVRPENNQCELAYPKGP